MDTFTSLELELLDRLIQKYPLLKSHIPFLQVSGRNATDAGMVVNIAYKDSETKPDPSDIDALFSNQERIHVKGLKNGLGYVIDVTDGEIQFIEFMTYDEKWNGKFDEYKIVPKAE